MDFCDTPLSLITLIKELDHAIEVSGRHVGDETLHWSIRCPIEHISVSIGTDTIHQNLSKPEIKNFLGAVVKINCVGQAKVALTKVSSNEPDSIVFSLDVVALTWRQVNDVRSNVQIDTFP